MDQEPHKLTTVTAIIFHGFLLEFLVDFVSEGRFFAGLFRAGRFVVHGAGGHSSAPCNVTVYTTIFQNLFKALN